jgi:hypothetical protein
MTIWGHHGFNFNDAFKAVLLSACIVGLTQSLSTSAQASSVLWGILTAPLQLLPHGASHDAAVPRKHAVRSREATAHPPTPSGTPGTPGTPEVSNQPAAAPANAAPTAPSTTSTTSTGATSTAAGAAVQKSAIEARVEATHAIPPSTAAAAGAQSAMPAAAPWPTASASVYEDLLGYVLLPADYADRLWAHGFGDLMGPLVAGGQASGKEAALALENGMCSAKASELAGGLVKRTAVTVAPNADQQAALDALGAAMTEVIERGRTKICSASGDPLARTAAGLWTMWDATLLMQPPLERFYASLDPAQQAKLAGTAAAAQALARACTDQRSLGNLARIAQTLPAEQRQRLDGLREHSADLIKILAASCPKEAEPTPIDRLKAARNRMNTLLYVAMTVASSMNESPAPQGSAASAR